MIWYFGSKELFSAFFFFFYQLFTPAFFVVVADCYFVSGLKIFCVSYTQSDFGWFSCCFSSAAAVGASTVCGEPTVILASVFVCVKDNGREWESQKKSVSVRRKETNRNRQQQQWWQQIKKWLVMLVLNRWAGAFLICAYTRSIHARFIQIFCVWSLNKYNCRTRYHNRCGWWWIESCKRNN